MNNKETAEKETCRGKGSMSLPPQVQVQTELRSRS
jgi:hypothetical protein